LEKFACYSEGIIAVLSSSNKQYSSSPLSSLLILLIIIIGHLTGMTMNAHANQTEISDQRNDIFDSGNDNPQSVVEHRQSDVRMSNIRPPFVSPNPVGPLGRVNFLVNETGVSEATESINISIKGPNLGSTNPLLSPATIGSLSMIRLSNTSQDGLWVGNFSFPPALPDGNYVYTLTTNDRGGQESTTNSFSGIILDRNPPDFADTKIISAIDGDGKAISNNSITVSPNITFTFEGTDRSGVIQTFECNLDDIVIRSEHDHGEEPDQNLTTYSVCSIPSQIAAHVPGNHTYIDLSPGNHTFKVRAIDNEYEMDPTPSNLSWSIMPSHVQ
jgi:hypothetical protein